MFTNLFPSKFWKIFEQKLFLTKYFVNKAALLDSILTRIVNHKLISAIVYKNFITFPSHKANH